MKSRLKGSIRRPAPGTILGLLALMVALGGTAVALPGSRVVDRNDLKRNVVGHLNMKDGAIHGPEMGEVTLRLGNDVSITDTTGQDGEFTSNGKSTVDCADDEILLSATINWTTDGGVRNDLHLIDVQISDPPLNTAQVFASTDTGLTDIFRAEALCLEG